MRKSLRQPTEPCFGRITLLLGGEACVALIQPEGVNDYAGVVATRIRENAPDTDFSSVTCVFVDAQVSASDPNMEQVLIRFDNIFGSETNQIPPGSKIHAAILDLASVGGDAMGDRGQFFPMLPTLAHRSSLVEQLRQRRPNQRRRSRNNPQVVAGNPLLDSDVQGYRSATVDGTWTKVGDATAPATQAFYRVGSE